MRANDQRKSEQDGERDAYVMRMPQRRFVGLNHLCPANRLFPTFLLHAKLVSGPIYPRPVSAIHTEYEKSNTKAIRYNCIVRLPVKQPTIAVVSLTEAEREGAIVSVTFATSNHLVYSEDLSVLHRA